MMELPHPNMTEDGLDQCPYCGKIFGATEYGVTAPNNYTYGPVYDTDGNEYETVGDTEPGSDVLHRECYLKYRGEDSQELTEFTQ